MSDSINILQRAENVEIAPLFNTYSKVILNIDDETQAQPGRGSQNAAAPARLSIPAI